MLLSIFKYYVVGHLKTIVGAPMTLTEDRDNDYMPQGASDWFLQMHRNTYERPGIAYNEAKAAKSLTGAAGFIR